MVIIVNTFLKRSVSQLATNMIRFKAQYMFSENQANKQTEISRKSRGWAGEGARSNILPKSSHATKMPPPTTCGIVWPLSVQFQFRFIAAFFVLRLTLSPLSLPCLFLSISIPRTYALDSALESVLVGTPSGLGHSINKHSHPSLFASMTSSLVLRSFVTLLSYFVLWINISADLV